MDSPNIYKMHEALCDEIKSAKAFLVQNARYNFTLNTEIKKKTTDGQLLFFLSLTQRPPYPRELKPYKRDKFLLIDEAEPIIMTPDSRASRELFCYNCDSGIAVQNDEILHVGLANPVKKVVRNLTYIIDLFEDAEETVSVDGIDFFSQFFSVNSSKYFPVFSQTIDVPRTYRSGFKQNGMCARKTFDKFIGNVKPTIHYKF